MHARLKWLVVVVYLMLLLVPLVWPESTNATLGWIVEVMVVGSLVLAPIMIGLLRAFFTRRPGLLLVAGLTLLVWIYFQFGGGWLAAHLQPALGARIDLLGALLGLQLLLAVPVLFVVWLLRRDASLWLLGLAWFLNPMLILLFASRFGSIEQMLTTRTLGSFQADMAWVLPNCLTGAACVVGGFGFVAYFVRLLILEVEGRPIKAA